MQYAHVAGLIYDTPLAITLDKAEEWDRFIQERIAGSVPRFSHEEAATAHEARMVAFVDSTGGRPTREGYALTESGIAVVPVHGSLVHRGGLMEAMSGVTGYNTIRAQLRAAERNPDVRGVVLDVDSPGGAVAGMFEVADDIRAMTKPTRALANEMATSSAYLLASATQKLYAKKTSVLGSIAVLALHADRSKQHEKQGVRHTAITSGKRKTELASIAPLSAEARTALQAQVDEVGDMFVAAVAEYRNADEDTIRATEGASLSLREAERAGLVDGTATLAQLIHDFAAELDADEANVERAARRTEQRPRAAASATLEGADDMPNPKEDVPAAQGTTPAITAEQLARERKEAEDAARLAERARVKAILESPEAVGREPQAAYFAHDTDMTAEAAIAALSKGEKKVAAPTNPLAAAMAREGNADVSADATGGEGEETVESVAKSIASHFANVTTLPKRGAA